MVSFNVMLKHVNITLLACYISLQFVSTDIIFTSIPMLEKSHTLGGDKLLFRGLSL